MADKEKKFKAKYNLADVNVQELAFASTPAVPKATFAVFKADDVPDGCDPVIKFFKFTKDDVKKQVYGYALVPEEPDSQGDVLNTGEIEKAAHSLLKNAFHKTDIKGTGSSFNHVLFDGIGFPIESAIDKDGSIGKAHGMEEGIPGAWWVGAQVTNDEIWGKIEKGEITGFSIGGSGVREAIEPADKSLMKVVTKGIKELYGMINKDDEVLSYSDAYQERENEDKMWEMNSALTSSIRSILESDAENKSELVSQSIDQFKSAMVAFVGTAKAVDSMAFKSLEKIFKAGSESLKKDKPPEGGEKMTDINVEEFKEKLEKIAKAVEPLADVPERLKKLEVFREELVKSAEKKNEDGENSSTQLHKSLIELCDRIEKSDPELDVKAELEKIKESVEKKEPELSDVMEALEKVNERMEKLEKTPGTRAGDDPNGELEKGEKKDSPGKAIFGPVFNKK